MAAELIRRGAWRSLRNAAGERPIDIALKPVKFRPIPTEIIALEPRENLYFGYPGMCGGFSMSSVRDQLLVNSWIRIVGGSGQADVITESGCVLVGEGFV